MNSGIARILFVIGCLCTLFGGIFGIFSVITNELNGLLILFVSISIGFLIIGFSEIIHLLNEINTMLGRRE